MAEYDGFSDADLDEAFGTEPSKQLDGFTDADFNDAFGDGPAKVDLTPYDSNPFEQLGKAFNIGANQVKQARYNLDIMNRNDLSTEDIRTAIKQGVPTGFSEDELKGMPWYQRAVLDATQMLPGIGDSIGQGALGAAAFAGPGALIGSRAGGPGAVAGASIGASRGFSIGSAKSIWEQTTGLIYGELIEEGLQAETAKKLSYVFGSINASLEIIGFKATQKLAGNAMAFGQKKILQKTLQDEAVRKIEENMLKRLGMDYAESVITNVGEEGLQAGSTEFSKLIGGVIEKGDPTAFTSPEESRKNISEQLATALGASLVLGAATSVGGATIGATGESVKTKANLGQLLREHPELEEQLKTMSPHDIAKNINAALQEQPFPWETGGEKVHVDPLGNVSITTGVTATGEAPLSPSKLDLNAIPNEIGQQMMGAQKPYLPELDIIDSEGNISNPGYTVQDIADFLGILPSDWDNIPHETKVQAAQQMQSQGIQARSFDELQDQYQQNIIDVTSSKEVQEGLDVLFPQEQDEAVPAETESRLIEPGDYPEEGLTELETQARMNQLTADQRLIQNEIKKLEQDIAVREKTGKPTEKKIQKLNSLYNAWEGIAQEAELLESGLVTREDIAGKYGKTKIKNITNLFRKLDKQVEKTVKLREKIPGLQEEAVKKGERQATQAIRSLQNQLGQIINAATKDPKIRAVLRQHIAKVTTPEQFRRAAKQIHDQLVNLERQKQQMQQTKLKEQILDKIERMLTGQKVRLQSGHPVSKLDADTTEKLQQFKEFVKKPQSATAFLQDFNTKHKQTLDTGDLNSIPADELQTYQIANMAQNLDNRTPMELQIIQGTIAQWIADGKAIIEAKRQALKDQRQQELDTALYSLNLNATGETNYSPTPRQEGQQLRESMQAEILTFDNLMRFITPQDQDHVLADLLDLSQAKHDFISGRNIVTAALQQTIQKALIDNGFRNINLMTKITEDSNTRYQLRARRTDGTLHPYNITKAEMIDIWMKLHDLTLFEAMKDDQTGNGWTFPGDTKPGESFVEVLSRALQPEDKIVAEAMLQFYRDYFPRLNEKYREKYGVDLPMRQNYSPTQKKGYQVDPPLADLQVYSLLPGSSKNRQDNKLAIVPRNAYSIAENQIQRWEYFRAYDDVLGTMNSVFTNPIVRAHIEQKHGYGTLDVIDKYIDRFVRNDPLPSTGTNALWAGLRADVSRASLGFRLVSSAATQMTAGLSMWKNYSVQDILTGAIETIKHPQQTEQAIRDSAVFEQRYKAGFSEELQQALRRQGLFAATMSKIFGTTTDVLSPEQHALLNRAMFYGITGGDALTIRMFGGPVYWAERKKGKSHDAALRATENVVETTQQGATVDQIPNIMAEHPMISTLFGMFRNQPLQLYGHSMIAVRNWLNSPKKIADWMSLGKDLATTWFIPGLILGLVRTAPSLMFPPGEDEDRTKEAAYDVFSSSVLGPVAGIPIFGDIIEALWFATAKPLFGVDKDFMGKYLGKNPVTDVFYNNPVEALKSWLPVLFPGDDTKLMKLGEEDKAAEKEAKAIAKSGKAFSQAAGVPGALFNVPIGVSQSLQNGDFIGAAFALGGWTPSQVKKRLPAEEDSGMMMLGEQEDQSPFDAAAAFARGFLAEQGLLPKQKDTPTPEEAFANGFLSDTIDEETEIIE